MIANCSTIERRPPRFGEMIRVCPTFGCASDFSMIYAPGEDDWYPVLAAVARDIDYASLVRVRLCENTAGERFLWCIDLADALPTDDSPMAAELAMATAAESVWCSRQETMMGTSFTTLPHGVFPEPIWGPYSVADSLENAFWDRVITSADHPLLGSRQVTR